MRVVARIAVLCVLMGLLFLMGSTYRGERGTFGGMGTARGVGGGGGGVAGLRVEAVLPGWGETPYIDITIDMGYPVSGSIWARCDSLEMFSVGLDSTELDTLLTRHRYVERVFLPDSVRAFKGDTLTVALNLNVGTFTYGFKLGQDLVGTMKHLILVHGGADTTHADLRACQLFQRYNNHPGVSVERYNQDGTVSVPSQTFARHQWDSFSAYSHSVARISAVGGSYEMPGTDEQQYIMDRVPWGSLISAGSTIVDARVTTGSTSNWLTAAQDTLIAILNTRSDDSEWFKLSVDGRGSGVFGRPGHTYASWKYQLQGTDDLIDSGNAGTMGTRGYPAVSAYPWNPTLADRGFQDWRNSGEPIIMQGTSDRNAAGSYSNRWVTGSWISWRLGRLVQAVVDGAANHGIVRFWRRQEAETAVRSVMAAWTQAAHSTIQRAPFYTVSYIEDLPYVDPMNDATMMVHFSTDDGHPASHVGWVAVVDSMRAVGHDVTFTAYLGAPKSGQWVAHADTFAAYGRRISLGNHSRWHTGGLTYGTDWAGPPDTTGYFWFYRDGGSPNFTGYVCIDAVADDYDTWIDDITPGAMDSLWVDIDPCWWDNFFEPGLTTYAQALGLDTAPALVALKRMGYTSLRAGWANNPVVMSDDGGYYHWFQTNNYAHGGDAHGDTLGCWRNHRLTDPINMLGFPATIGTRALVGLRAGPRLSEAQVRANVRARYAGVRLRGSYIMSWISHDDGTGAYTDNHAITSEELSWIFDELLLLGAKIVTVDEASAWRWSLSVPVATPGTWGQAAAYRWTREDNVWGRLRWLEAVKLGGGVPWHFPGGVMY